MTERSRPADRLVPNRACGACTACCRILEIEPLAKPAGVLCRHSTGAACGVYESRPETCVRWYCLWRRVAALPNALRPDRSGVMFSLDSHSPSVAATPGACIVGRAVNGAGALDRWQAIAAFAMFVREGSLPVWKATGRHAILLHSA